MSDVMKTAALIHKVSSPNFELGPTAEEILFSATRAGARSARLSETTGQVAPGYKADLVFYDRDAIAFTPENDVVRQLVYCENGDSIREVVVDGRTVVREGICLTIDEAALLGEVRAATSAFLRHYESIEQANLVFEPHLREIYQRAWRRGVGIERLASAAPR